VVSDDVTAHEWAHAYTEWTHGLIYQWQPGALNEAYSDIFGELVDQLNGRGTDSPGLGRDDGACSSSGGSDRPELVVTAPVSIAGPYTVGGAAFNPGPPWSVSGPVERVDDGVGVGTDGCQPISGFTAGRIALIDRGECFFRDKVVHAQLAGAIGVIVVNNQGDDVLEMGGDPPRLSIPAVFVGQSDGDVITTSLHHTVTATISLDSQTSDSVRWIIGEDASRLGSIRDMWQPSCFGDPGRVGSGLYACSEVDNGGVHSNSGVPNHAFALLVDGGSYNGEQIPAIGATKAARIYWRAMTVYQTPVTNFAAHADLLEQSCLDLVGQPLYDLLTGALSAERIQGPDCASVAAAMRAVEMRADPVRCSFTSLLDPESPPLPGNLTVFEDRFDSPAGLGWTRSNRGVFPEYEPRDWLWTDDPPEGGDGGAYFAVDSVFIGDCVPGSDDQSGAMALTSPVIELPLGARNPVLAFDHWVATEAEWDGGNVKISVNGGPFVMLTGGRFLHNSYSGRLRSASGNPPNPNPLAGEQAFTGTDQGTLGGSWGQSQVDLTGLVEGGDLVSIRFDFGVDGCNGVIGWYIDNVRVTADANEPRRIGRRVAP
jgi:hypothetical protein